MRCCGNTLGDKTMFLDTVYGGYTLDQWHALTDAERDTIAGAFWDKWMAAHPGVELKVPYKEDHERWTK